MIHTGLGYDMHRLVTGRKLFLGGIEIPFEKGEDGHSDGDVLLHAITDALLGASGLGDIGSFFPPEEAKWKDADSKVLLKTVWDKITEKGWKLENLDCVIKIEEPKFLPHRQEVIKSIAQVLEVPEDSVFVKAKTYEKTGNWENQVEAFATCLLSK
ncbi:MAG: 2-C-methyl-D-erythritol 2,4-cyclodiphosphate synthase [Treponema sp.]|nr:2-C-methyl-D-erythritol 2,4-cyclodiphosphate synthase [Treponema sp.]